MVVAPCREAGADSAPRPAWRSPVELGRGPPLGLPGVATESFLQPAPGHGVCGALLGRLPLSAWLLGPLTHGSELGFAAVFCAKVQNKRLKSDSSGHWQLPSPPAPQLWPPLAPGLAQPRPAPPSLPWLTLHRHFGCAGEFHGSLRDLVSWPTQTLHRIPQ